MGKHVLTAEDGSKGGKKSKRRPYDQVWREKLDEKIKSGPYKGKTVNEMLFDVLKTEAGTGNIQAIKELYERSYGKAKQFIDIEHTGDFNNNITFEFVESKKKKKG
jgi:hypothetical protein